MSRLRRFSGSLEQLRAVVSTTGLAGTWQRIPYGWCYRCRSGAIINWWPAKGSLTFQGPPDRAEEFEEALLTAAFNEESPQAFLVGDDGPEHS